MASFTGPNTISNGSLASRSLGLLVCGYCSWIFSFSLLLSKPTFSAASPSPENIPTSNPPLKTAVTINTSHRIVIALSISTLFLTWILLMAYFSCLRFKANKKISHQEEGRECESKKTHVPDQTDSASRSSCGDLIVKEKTSVWRFEWDEIEQLSLNFSSVIGEGGFSMVYLARFSDSTFGALKIHRNSERLCRVFKQELAVLMQLHHENIVKLIGYCDEREEGVLVFEYVSNGSLHDKLHGQGGTGNLLPWNRRMLIAFQLAQAIKYLHDNCPLQIIHSDIKASNVLLDDQLNCKLCDFGCAKMGFSSTILPSSMNPVMGSPGYVDPHYMRTGIISKKNDVYSFGVLLLELITGIEAFCTEKQQLLTSLAVPILRDTTKVTDMIDSRLAGEFDEEEAMAMASISALCLQGQPSLRPSMAEILRTMRDQISSVSFVAGRLKENGTREM
ncbi:salt tolerance receptor-like cytoplasmic kinase 1 [Magnolia sinica]|uniref:salt tolerance receptor-like cytoplasmic kinase 1 n=1 Tax=Magnolia sinica TaxID=86752 RepID=UPI00265A33B0|nr:salt tolerance receptor-like cytoplasmic kinase 1 [Magnolia sinica]